MKAEQNQTTSLPPRPSRRRPAIWFFLACAVWLGFRLFYNSLHDLTPDEAYYWVWSRHPAGGYLDHPPMVAWLIGLSARLFGTSEFGVRFPAAILTLGMILVLYRLVRRLCPDASAARLAGWVLLLCPMTAVLGNIMTPDTPACFFGLCALAAAVAAVSGTSAAAWPVAGLFMGLAFLSKYTSILVAVSIALALLSTSQGRRHFKRPWIWLGALICLAVFWPNLLWNQQNHWAAFGFQWHHGTSAQAASPLQLFLLYLGGQAGIYTPVLFALGLLALGWQWRRLRTLGAADRMVLIAATLPLVFFGLFSLRHKPEPNWPVFAYLPMTAVLTQWIAQDWSRPRLHWMRIGLIVAAAATLAIHLPQMILLAPNRYLHNVPNPWDELYGWRQYGHELDRLAVHGGRVYCTSYENASEAAFYMAGHPAVWMIDEGRPTAFDFFPGRPDPASLQKVVCVTRFGSGPADIPDALQGFAGLRVEDWQATALRRTVRRRRFIIAQRQPPSP
jgi:4-amino-4-deoxy-L-arabinose transferase-like glycosyltransferase